PGGARRAPPFGASLDRPCAGDLTASVESGLSLPHRLARALESTLPAARPVRALYLTAPRRGLARTLHPRRPQPPPIIRTTSSRSPSRSRTSPKRPRLTISPLYSAATVNGSTPCSCRYSTSVISPVSSRRLPLIVSATIKRSPPLRRSTRIGIAY